MSCVAGADDTAFPRSCMKLGWLVPLTKPRRNQLSVSPSVSLTDLDWTEVKSLESKVSQWGGVRARRVMGTLDVSGRSQLVRHGISGCQRVSGVGHRRYFVSGVSLCLCQWVGGVSGPLRSVGRSVWCLWVSVASGCVGARLCAGGVSSARLTVWL